MTCRFIRLLPLACAIPATLAHADSGIGVDTWRGNKLDPTAGQANEPCDARGTTWLAPLQRRSPTGNLYNCAPESPLAHEIGEWLYYGVLQVGYIGTGDHDVASWNRYADWRNGDPVLGLLQVNFERPSDGSYAEVRASRISSDDQLYQAVFGRAGAYKVQAFVRDMPNILSTNAKPIWNGVGTNNLTVPVGLTPGASTPAQVAAASAAAPTTTLGVKRSKQGLSASTYLSPEWTAYVDLSEEERKGTRAYGGPFFFAFAFAGPPFFLNDGGVDETVKPINDSTININGGLRYAGAEWRFDFSYSGSFYRDKYTSYNYQSPFKLTALPAVPGAIAAPLYQGQMSMEPDNDYHNFRATATRKIPWNGEISLSASGGRMSQDDTLIAPINCQGVFGIGFGNLQLGPANPLLMDCSKWNTTDALSRKTADMRIDTSMVDARIVLNPTREWSLRGGVKYDRQDYRNVYLSYNPLTGQYGYPSENGAQGSIVPGELGLWDPKGAPSALTRVRSLPLDIQTIDANVGADWKFDQKNTLSANLDYNRYEPTNRERSQIDASRVKLTWVNRSLDWLTLRVNYTYLKQTGNTYDFDPYEHTFSSSLPGYIPPAGGTPSHTVDAMRKYDMSSRDENKIDVMATVMPRDDMTLSASVRGDWNSYDAQIGRQAYDTVGATLQWDWQLATQSSLGAYVAWDRSRLGMSNVQDKQGGSGVDPSLGGPNYALTGQWWTTDAQRDWYAGLTFNHNIGRARFDLNWNYLYSRGLTDYSYAGSSALAYPASVSDAGPGGGAFPNMVYRVNSITAGVTVPFTERVSLRLFEYYERGRISDWHYLGFDQGLVVGNRVYTDTGPQSYKQNLIGMLVNVKL
ncbi:MAG: MtrB/PioB family outer membrane beta-barrel protein [Proteobacteria bacterium]|uniref:MtrB/PioB family outer membrane beta-barrel protein n=1 Tax=Rudaea sp. TaxID=2136325 RepID=UPI00321FA871|nr:MtrB/PioB family outer membrane beta-barrel protein [Pseudomonadota bacterium]